MKITISQLRRIIREQIESEYYTDLKNRTSDKGQLIGKSKDYSNILLQQMDTFIEGMESDNFNLDEISFTAYHELKNAVQRKLDTIKSTGIE